MAKAKTIAIALVAAGCAVNPDRPSVLDNSRSYTASYDAVWSAAIDALTADRLAVDTIAKDSGLLVASGQPPDLGQQTLNCRGSLAMATLMNTPDEEKVTYTVRIPPADAPMVTVTTRFTLVYRDGKHAGCDSNGVLERRFLDALSTRLQ